MTMDEIDLEAIVEEHGREREAPDGSDVSDEEEAESTQETETEPEKTVTTETIEDEAETEDEAGEGEEQSPPHVVSYKRSGEDMERELQYGEDGRLADEEVDHYRQLLEKEGLEDTAQSAREGQKRTQRDLDATNARLQAAERDRVQLQAQVDGVAPTLKAIDRSPQVKQYLDRTLGAERYDPEKARLQAENEYHTQQETRAESDRIVENAVAEFRREFPELNDEAIERIGMNLAHQDYGHYVGSLPPQQQGEAVTRGFTMARSHLILIGELPDPRTEELAAKEAEIAKKKKHAEERAAVRSPVAGGGGKGAAAGKKRRKSLSRVSDQGFGAAIRSRADE